MRQEQEGLKGERDLHSLLLFHNPDARSSDWPPRPFPRFPPIQGNGFTRDGLEERCMSAIPSLNPLEHISSAGKEFTEEEIEEVTRICNLMKYGNDTDLDCIRLSELFF